MIRTIALVAALLCATLSAQTRVPGFNIGLPPGAIALVWNGQPATIVFGQTLLYQWANVESVQPGQQPQLLPPGTIQLEPTLRFAAILEEDPCDVGFCFTVCDEACFECYQPCFGQRIRGLGWNLYEYSPGWTMAPTPPHGMCGLHVVGRYWNYCESSCSLKPGCTTTSPTYFVPDMVVALVTYRVL